MNRLRVHMQVVRNYMRSFLPSMHGLAVLAAWEKALCAMLAALLFATVFALHPSTRAAWATSSVDTGDNTVDARQTADNSFLYDTNIYELSNADASFQGDTVQVVGEVVGDSFRAEEDPGKRWITLEGVEDDGRSASISVLVDENVVNLIDTYGAYGRQGTMLQVRGTFYLACPSHEGIIDIHADNVMVVASGSESHDTFNLDDFMPGLVVVGIGLVLSGIYYFLRERER